MKKYISWRFSTEKAGATERALWAQTFAVRTSVSRTLPDTGDVSKDEQHGKIGVMSLCWRWQQAAENAQGQQSNRNRDHTDQVCFTSGVARLRTEEKMLEDCDHKSVTTADICPIREQILNLEFLTLEHCMDLLYPLRCE